MDDAAGSLAGLEAHLQTLRLPGDGRLGALMGAKLIRNANLDILLELYVACAEGRQVGASALGRALDASPTTLLRMEAPQCRVRPRPSSQAGCSASPRP